MKRKLVTYKINQADYESIYDHLIKCNQIFTPPLDQRVEIKSYAEKILANAATFEAWHEEELVGLLAVYCNDTTNKEAFITNVSVMIDFENLGIASHLLSICRKHIDGLHFKAITLTVNKKNEKARYLYKKNGYLESRSENDMIVMRLDLSDD